MGLFDQFPFTNFHEMNLDWLIKSMQELKMDIKEFLTDEKIKELISEIQLGVVNVNAFGITDDGIDHTDKMLTLVNSIPDGVTLFFPRVMGKGYNVNFTISKHDITIDGTAEMMGTIKVLSNWPNNTPINLQIKNLIFTSQNPIIIQRGTHISISNCLFKDCDKAVSIYPIGEFDSETYAHCVEEVNVHDCRFQMCNTCLDISRGSITGVPQEYLLCGDIAIRDCYAKVCKVHAVRVDVVDGLNIQNNVFFTYATMAGLDKLELVKVTHGIGVIIDCNDLFDAGSSAVAINTAERCIISNNTITNAGSMVLADAIALTTGHNNIIDGNMIYTPSRNGITAPTDTCVAGNSFVNTDNTIALPTITQLGHYAISGTMQMYANSVADPSQICEDGTPLTQPAKIVQVDSGATLPDAEIYKLNYSTNTTITNITPHNDNGRIVTFISYTPNATFANSGNIKVTESTVLTAGKIYRFIEIDNEYRPLF